MMKNIFFRMFYDKAVGPVKIHLLFKYKHSIKLEVLDNLNKIKFRLKLWTTFIFLELVFCLLLKYWIFCHSCFAVNPPRNVDRLVAHNISNDKYQLRGYTYPALQSSL